jgi:CBS-domain-containing membrane protein
MLSFMITRWGTRHRPTVPGCLWMAALLGALTLLDQRRGGIYLVPPFVATMTILLYLPGVAIAQPFAIVFGSVLGAATGTVVALLLGSGPGVAMAAALAAVIVLPLLRAFHPPGVALAMYPALLHPGPWFAVEVVLPFTLAAVISAAVMSWLLRGWPQYPAPLRNEGDGERDRSRLTGRPVPELRGSRHFAIRCALPDDILPPEGKHARSE